MRDDRVHLVKEVVKGNPAREKSRSGKKEHGTLKKQPLPLPNGEWRGEVRGEASCVSKGHMRQHFASHGSDFGSTVMRFVV